MWIHLKIQPYTSSETYAHDENIGKRNTAYIESICLKPGYSGGAGGGRLLRLEANSSDFALSFYRTLRQTYFFFLLSMFLHPFQLSTSD